MDNKKHLWFMFHNSDLMLRLMPDGTHTLPWGDMPPMALQPEHTTHTITDSNDGTRMTIVDLTTETCIPEGYELCPLRRSFYLLPLDLYMKAGRCHHMVYWQRTTRFCGMCGGTMQPHAENSRRCSACGHEVWPNPATAVITLIHRGDELLLIRAHNFRSHFYGLVAGFVEAGETLEEAATREILEEVGIEVYPPQYVMSQPWPYPNGLMVGFMAEYKSGDISLQQSEIAEGAWFDKHCLPAIPEPLSIARKIIDRWVAEGAPTAAAPHNTAEQQTNDR